jgi:2-oxo-4-hydroxy-4-carboxy-5-ureidoimidazoline decarboxylase
MTIDELNALDQKGFVAVIGWVFEHSPWVAERAWNKRPFVTAGALHQAMVEQVKAASREEQLGLLRAHPDLGTRTRVSEASAVEQGGVGLDRLTPEEFEELQRLNNNYRDKFGFPFLFAVKGSTKYDILRALRVRLNSGTEEEYAEALRQAYRIAGFRIQDSVA